MKEKLFIIKSKLQVFFMETRVFDNFKNFKEISQILVRNFDGLHYDDFTASFLRNKVEMWLFL